MYNELALFLVNLTLFVARCSQWCRMFSYLTVELVPRLYVFTLVWKISDRQLNFNVYQGKVCLKFVVKYLSYALEKTNKPQCCGSRHLSVHSDVYLTYFTRMVIAFIFCAQVLCSQKESNCIDLISPNIIVKHKKFFMQPATKTRVFQKWQQRRLREEHLSIQEVLKTQ